MGKILATTTTIAAQATPAGRGGIGVIRLSGPLVSKIAAKLLGIVPKPRYALHTLFKDQNGNAIDDGLALYFNKPNSFTGEDVLELQGHGGQVILDLLLKRVLELGAILARPGEFSERAFINGKIDLAQAEAIADLIDASSSEAALSAVRSLRGDFSTLVNELKEKIIALRVAIEAEIDFADEELELDSYANKHASLENILNLLANIQQSANQGALLRDGVNVVITGKPNAGKSSLLNYLAREDMAIVTPIPGTTRDVLRSQILLDGLPINIIDTAGLQVTEDIIEQEGIRRARQEIATADHILCIIDKSAITSQNPLDVILELHLPETNKNHITVLYNKIDLTKDKPAILVINGISCIYLSLKNITGLDLLRAHLKQVAGFQTQENSIFSARRRHIEALERVSEKLYSAKQHFLHANPQAELIAEDLKNAQQELAAITGEFSSEDLLNQIFSEFCIGK